VLSRKENRCVLTYLWYTSHSTDLISLFMCFGKVLRNLTAYQMMRLRWGASQVPAKRAEQALPLSNLVAQISHWTFPAAQDLSSSIQTTDPPLGRYLGGDRYLSSSCQSCIVMTIKAIPSHSQAQACSSGRCRAVEKCNRVRVPFPVSLPVFSTVVFTIVAFPTHPAHG
jgi:hypothetical protein